MSEENVQLSGADLVRWITMALLIAGCVAAYFLLAPRVPPVFQPAAEETPA
jgi:hypothetical protein